MASRFLNFFLILVFVFASLAILIHFNLFSLKDTLYDKYPNLKIRKYLFSSKPIFNKINNDYNAKFLPYTEFVKLDLIKKKINFNKNYYTHNSQKKNIAYSKYGSFYLDIHKKNLIITDYLGNIYNSEIEGSWPTINGKVVKIGSTGTYQTSKKRTSNVVVVNILNFQEGNPKFEIAIVIGSAYQRIIKSTDPKFTLD